MIAFGREAKLKLSEVNQLTRSSRQRTHGTMHRSHVAAPEEFTPKEINSKSQRALNHVKTCAWPFVWRANMRSRKLLHSLGTLPPRMMTSQRPFGARRYVPFPPRRVVYGICTLKEHTSMYSTSKKVLEMEDLVCVDPEVHVIVDIYFCMFFF